ncbi:hypothetical protein T4C_9439 [Trichinella pseudospiralis]|uniref:MULE transposase domain-containing protein n=1 Tax=Trichinella pseudospiralis TaxID=6337 RepID=A0A0V1IVD7_TRIPS|nr:hypothetical protein T4C_9439 [Trichinella pseudospiralis]
MFTIHVFIADFTTCDFETALIPALQGTFPGFYIKGCYFHFFQAVLRKVTDLGTRTSYIHEAATKKKVKMLLAMCRVQRKR